MKRPWFKFYPTDWTGDQRLRKCSFSARGLWIDLCAYMHEGDPYGHLDIDGIDEADEIAALTGRPVAETKLALAELEKRGVFSRTAGGVIFSRRMVRARERAEVGREHIAKRWGKGNVIKPNWPKGPNR